MEPYGYNKKKILILALYLNKYYINKYSNKYSAWEKEWKLLKY